MPWHGRHAGKSRSHNHKLKPGLGSLLVSQHSGAGSGKIVSSRPAWEKWEDPVCRAETKETTNKERTFKAR